MPIDPRLFENQMSKEEFERLIQKSPDQPGATGKFPDGKMTPLDEGELQVKIGAQDGRIVIDFGKNVTWLGLRKSEALALGQMIIEKALKL